MRGIQGGAVLFFLGSSVLQGSQIELRGWIEGVGGGANHKDKRRNSASSAGGVLEFSCNALLFSLEGRNGSGEGCAPPSPVTPPLHGSITLELSPS